MTTSAETAPSKVTSQTVPATTETPTTPPTTEIPTTTLPPTTTVPESGISLAAPALVGEAVQVGDWAIRVVAVTPDTTEAIAAENQFNDPPAEGKRFFMATLEATYTGTESSTFWVEMTLKAIGASSVAYEAGFDTSCGVIPSEISNAGEAFPGSTITGNACWAVDAPDAASLTMIAEPSFSFDNDARRFLSMNPTATPLEDSTTTGAPTPQRRTRCPDRRGARGGRLDDQGRVGYPRPREPRSLPPTSSTTRPQTATSSSWQPSKPPTPAPSRRRSGST